MATATRIPLVIPRDGAKVLIVKFNDFQCPACGHSYLSYKPILAKYGGKVLARGGRYQINEGPHDFHRFVVIEFATLEQGVKCFESPEYQEAAAFRRNGGGVVENVVVDGGDATQ